MGFKRFPEFGKELKRRFPVHENCYDGEDFHNGGESWPASKPFACPFNSGGKVCYAQKAITSQDS